MKVNKSMTTHHDTEIRFTSSLADVVQYAVLVTWYDDTWVRDHYLVSLDDRSMVIDDGNEGSSRSGDR